MARKEELHSKMLNKWQKGEDVTLDRGPGYICVLTEEEMEIICHALVEAQ